MDHADIPDPGQVLPLIKVIIKGRIQIKQIVFLKYLPHAIPPSSGIRNGIGLICNLTTGEKIGLKTTTGS